MKEYYRINEISKLYGIGADSLRYYEKLGVIKPKRDQNGYRLYGLKDMYKLNLIRDLRGLDFSMSQIREYLEKQSIDNTLSLLKQELELVRLTMEELKEKERCLQKRLAGLHEALSVKPDVMEIIHISSRRCVQITEHITRDEEMDFVMKKLHRRHEDKIKDFGNQTVGARFDMEGLRQGDSNVYDSVFFVLEEDAGLYDFELPEGNYLSFFYQGGYLQNGRRVKEALSWLEEKGLYASGAAFELYAIDNRDTSLEEEFLTEIQIPVSAASSRASKP